MDQKQKTHGIYLSFMQLGRAATNNEHGWMLLAVVRSTEVKKIAGGFSSVFGRVLETATQCFKDGVMLDLGGDVGAVLCYVTVDRILGDESELKHIWDVKGASGLRCCFKCRNVVLSRSELARHSDRLVDIGEHRASRFEAATDDDMYEAHEMLAAERARGAAATEELEKALGQNFNAHGILTRTVRLKPCSMSTFDWMHVWCANGVASTEFWLLLRALNGVVGFADLRRYCSASWNWPHNHAKKAKGVAKEFFSEVRERATKKAESLKHQASEFLHIYMLLADFLAEVVEPLGLARDGCKSFLKVCACIDLLQACKFGYVPCNAGGWLLQQRVSEHLQLLSVTHEGACKPKHHYAMHVGQQLRRDQMVLDAFVTERKHRTLRTAVERLHGISSGASHERTCVLKAAVLQEHLMSDGQGGDIFQDALHGKSCEVDGAVFGVPGSLCLMAQGLKVAGFSVFEGDIIMLSRHILRAWAVIAYRAWPTCNSSMWRRARAKNPTRLIPFARSLPLAGSSQRRRKVTATGSCALRSKRFPTTAAAAQCSANRITCGWFLRQLGCCMLWRGLKARKQGA